MPEYLAPGVFVEEVSFRSKSIEGVATSTTGFAGLASYGPVYYPGGPCTCEPRLITSFTEFERVYGGMEDIEVGETSPGIERTNYLAHAVRAFFENGGKRVYISRVFSKRAGDNSEMHSGVAYKDAMTANIEAAWMARWPGKAGNVYVKTEVVRSKNLAFVNNDGKVQVKSVKPGAVVEVSDAGVGDSDNPVEDHLRVVELNESGEQEFVDKNGDKKSLSSNPIPFVQLLEMKVQVQVNNERTDEYVGLAASKKTKTLYR